jgi:hypothetical protein
MFRRQLVALVVVGLGFVPAVAFGQETRAEDAVVSGDEQDARQPAVPPVLLGAAAAVASVR